MNAFLLTESIIQQMTGREASDGKYLAGAGRVINRWMDTQKVYADILTDENTDPVSAWLSLDLKEMSAYSASKQEMLKVVAALMYAWLDDRDSFFPRMGGPEANALIQNRNFARLLGDAVGAKNIPQYLANLHGRQLLRDKVEKVAVPGQKHITNGTAFWETPTLPAAAPQTLAATLDAEFTTPQLRELAKWLDVKLHGNAKSGFLESILSGISARLAEMQVDPDALVRGLTDEQSDFARRILTARDWQLPVPRSVLQTVTGRRDSRDPLHDRKLTELTEGLRRHALLFPSHRPFFYGIRDSFYQWLPLEPANARPPVLTWPGVTREAASSPRPAPVFLDQFDAFIHAVMAGGVELRPARKAHVRTQQTAWLRGWEHDASEAETILTSRTGWAPDQNTGISVVLDSPLAADGLVVLQNQTGQTAPELELYFALAAALQLIEAPSGGRAGQPVSILPQYAVHARARTSAVEEWLALSDSARLRRVWEAWQNALPFAPEAAHAQENTARTPQFLLLRRIGAQDFSLLEFFAEFCALRRYATRVLRGLPVGAVVDWAALREKLFAFYPDAAWQTHTPYTWWFANFGNRSRMNPAKQEDWNKTVGAILEKIFGEAMALFGAVEIERDKHGQLTTLRVTELGAWLTRDLGEREFPAAAKPRPRQVEEIAWLDGARLRLPPAPDRAEFIRFARLVAEPDAAPFTYAITRASLETALKTGLTADEIIRAFEGVNAPLPAPSRKLLDGMAAKFGKVRVYEDQTVLLLNDDFSLRELMAATSLGSHILFQLSPRAVIVNEAALPELLREMEAKGYTPAVKG